MLRSQRTRPVVVAAHHAFLRGKTQFRFLPAGEEPVRHDELSIAPLVPRLGLVGKPLAHVLAVAEDLHALIRNAVIEALLEDQIGFAKLSDGYHKALLTANVSPVVNRVTAIVVVVVAVDGADS